MFARGKSVSQELSSVGRFFSPGSTLHDATAFTKTAIARDRNAPSVGPIADELGACDEHPVQEMQFFNVGGAKVFYYYGLDTIRTPEHIMGAG